MLLKNQQKNQNLKSLWIDNVSKGNAKPNRLTKIVSIILYLNLKYNLDFIMVDRDVKSLYLPIGGMKILSLFYMQKPKLAVD